MLTPQNAEAIRKIEDAIGYTFNDKRLLVQALTRKTYLKIDPEAPDHEVLEFYGDTLMNYHVTNYFMSKYAHMLDDGLFFMRTVEQFTDMRSHYVCNRYLTDRVKSLGLARYLRAQNRDSELRRDGEKAYADVFESLVGAIYLDSCQNDELIRAFILRQLGIEPKRQPDEIEAFDYDTLTRPASAVSAEALPSVEEDEVTKTVALPDTLTAAVEVSAATEEAVTEIPDATSLPATEVQKEETLPADDSAPAGEASPAILPEALPSAEPEVTSLPLPAAPRSKQEALAAFCLAAGYELPTYGETPPNAPNARPVAACTLKYKDTAGKLVKISLNDSGKTLTEATEKAAAKMLKKLEKQAAPPPKAAEPRRERPAAPVSAPAAETLPAEAEPQVQISLEVAPVPEAVPAVVTPAVETAVETAMEDNTVEAVPAEEAPVEAVAEATPAEDAHAEAVAEATPAEEAPVEAVAEATPAEEVPVEAVAEATPAEEAPAVPKTVRKRSTAKKPADRDKPADKKATAKKAAGKKASGKKTAAAESMAKATHAAEAVAEPAAEPAVEAVVETPTEVVTETVVEAAVEAAVESTPMTEDKPKAKKASPKKTTAKTSAKRSAAKAKATATPEALPLQDVTEPSAEATPDAAPATDVPAEEVKPRARKPRTKKAVEAADAAKPADAADKN